MSIKHIFNTHTHTHICQEFQTTACVWEQLLSDTTFKHEHLTREHDVSLWVWPTRTCIHALMHAHAHRHRHKYTHPTCTFMHRTVATKEALARLADEARLVTEDMAAQHAELLAALKVSKSVGGHL
jgi:hypothetical protein